MMYGSTNVIVLPLTHNRTYEWQPWNGDFN